MILQSFRRPRIFQSYGENELAAKVQPLVPDSGLQSPKGPEYCSRPGFPQPAVPRVGRRRTTTKSDSPQHTHLAVGASAGPVPLEQSRRNSGTWGPRNGCHERAPPPSGLRPPAGQEGAARASPAAEAVPAVVLCAAWSYVIWGRATGW